MKRILSLTIAIYLSCIPLCVKANAESPRYGRILTESVGLYSDRGEDMKFFIPYSYYVKILSIGEIYTKVSYGYEDSKCPILTGYIRNVDLNLIDYIPTSPYAVITLTVISDGVLFNDSDLSFQKIGVCSGSQVYYYGSAYSQDGEDLCYVCYDGYLGYMRTSCFSPFSVKLNPDPIESPDDEESQSANEPARKTPSFFRSDTMQIMIIACISIVAISIVYLLFKPQDTRMKSKANEDDE